MDVNDYLIFDLEANGLYHDATHITVLHTIILNLMKLNRLMMNATGKVKRQAVKVCRLLLFEQYSTYSKLRLLLAIILLVMIFQLSVNFIPSLSLAVLLLIPCSLVASIIHDLCE